MKRLQIMLAVMGVFAMIAGTLIVVSSVTVAKPSDPILTTTTGNVVYVGVNTCFTCHGDSQRDGWHALHPQIIQDPVDTPQVILADFSEAPAARQINTGSEMRPYTSVDTTYQASGNSSLRYVMKTEDGDAVLPGGWVINTVNTDEADSTGWIESCGGCHDAAADHIRLAQKLDSQASSDEIGAVRDSIVTMDDPTFCGRCHDGEARSYLKDGETDSMLPQSVLQSRPLAATASGSAIVKQPMFIFRAVLWNGSTAHLTNRRDNPIR